MRKLYDFKKTIHDRPLSFLISRTRYYNMPSFYFIHMYIDTYVLTSTKERCEIYLRIVIFQFIAREELMRNQGLDKALFPVNLNREKRSI